MNTLRFALVALLLAACSCRVEKPSTSENPTITGDASLFQVPDDQLAHLKITEVRKVYWLSIVTTTGTVDWDENKTTQAITQVNGPITRLLVDTGDRVTAGQPLLYVSSTDVSAAVAALRVARNHLDFATRTLNRSKDLLAHKVIAVKDLEAAEQDYNNAQTEVANSIQALKIFGISAADIDAAKSSSVPINPELAVRSPISGVIVQKLVSPGLVVQGGVTPCFVISNVSTVWVQGHVYDRDLESVRIGDRVDETDSAFHRSFHGVVGYIGAALDPATRTTPVRIVTANPDDLLKKDMFVDAVIHTRSGRSLLAGPTSAILRTDDNLPFVYVEVGPGNFAQRLITIGGQQGDETEIVSGCTEGEKIVAAGSVFLQFANSNR